MTLALPSLDAAALLVDVGHLFVLVAGFGLGVHVGVYLHERAHLLVAEWYGYDASIRLIRAERLPIYYQGEMNFSPAAMSYDVEALPTRISRRISYQYARSLT
jgi:hypothetical protein